jgi:hypothetical protein
MIGLVQDRGQWWACVNFVMNLQVPREAGNFLINNETIINMESKWTVILDTNAHSLIHTNIIYPSIWSWDRSVNTVSSLWARWPETGFDSWKGPAILLLCTASILALGPTQPRFLVASEAHFTDIKQQRHETEHTSPSSAKVKNHGSISPLPICLFDVVFN